MQRELNKCEHALRLCLGVGRTSGALRVCSRILGQCQVRVGETIARNLIPARALRKPSHEPRPGVGD